MAYQSENAVATTPETPLVGFNKTKRQWARGFLWVTSALLINDRPFLSLLTSSCAVYSMHGGKWLSQKNMKWMTASIISFVVSLYALALRTESDFVDEERAYELKATLAVKHRAAEIVWGGILLMVLCLTIKEHIDNAVNTTSEVIKVARSSLVSDDKAKIKSG